ncbi:MAG: PEP-CTERM sorting domain-containing protein [Planctomycetota bacterium]
MGSVAGDTTVNGGELRLHAGSSESVAVVDGTLALWSGEAELEELTATGAFSLTDSTLMTFADRWGAQDYIVRETIVIGGASNKIATERGALTLASGVSGSGYLTIDPSRDNPVNIAGTIDDAIELELAGGPTRFLRADAYDGDILLNSGGLFVESPQQFGRIRGNGEVSVAAGASLIVDRIELDRGLIQGTVHAANHPAFRGFLPRRAVSHVDSGLTVDVYGGELTIDDTDSSRDPTNGTVAIRRRSEASILLKPSSVTEADLELNGGSGFNFNGALRTGDEDDRDLTSVLRGSIDLGNEGAHIGGSNTAKIEGPVVGGDLHLGIRNTHPVLSVGDDVLQFVGSTNIYSGEIALHGSATLRHTSDIDVHPDGFLYADSAVADPAVVDRVADDVVIRLFGGEVSAWSTEAGTDTVERVGVVQAVRGLSSLYGTRHVGSRDDPDSTAALVVGDLDRMPGAIITTRPHQARGIDIGSRLEDALVLENPPSVVHGVLPPWINHFAAFTSLDADGRVTYYDSPTTPLHTADETSVARPENPFPLSQDKTIHALDAFDSAPPVDLGGHTLTIGNGGINGATISNGTVQPGEYANGELIFFGGNTINADIIDNGSPTSVVFVGDVALGGTNTYTGKTYVVGRPGDDVFVTNRAALPTGTDLELSSHARLYLEDLSGGDYRFGAVAIRGGARLTLSCCDVDDAVTAESILLESGALSAPLVGDMPIVKRTGGVAELELSSPGYSGQVDVVEGMLIASYPTFGEGTVKVGPNGRLALRPADPGVAADLIPEVQLNGGALYGTDGYRSGWVNLNSDLAVTDDSSIYTLDATADHPVIAGLWIDGTIQVAAGKSLEVNGPSILLVHGGISLGDGAELGGNGSIRGRVEIANGSVLSPGFVGERDSVGMLATSTPRVSSDPVDVSMTWGEGGRYRWEINDALGEAGAPFGHGWDVFQIGQKLNVEATPQEPFVIEPVGKTKDGEKGLVEGLAVGTPYRWLIAERYEPDWFSAVIEGFDANRFVVDVSQLQEFYPDAEPEHFWLDQGSDGIYLNALIVSEHTADLNGDDVVDGNDLTDPHFGWEARFGVSLDGSSFLQWQREFGGAANSAVNQVPEPSTLVCGLLGIVAGAAARRRSHRIRQESRVA